MAGRDVVALNEQAARLEVPQAGDIYTMPRDVQVQGTVSCQQVDVGGYLITAQRAQQAVDGAAVAQQAAAQAQAADQQVQQLLAAMQQITVGGVAATVVPAPGNAPVADANGNLDPGWLPEIFALTRVVAELAAKQVDINNRLLAAGI